MSSAFNAIPSGFYVNAKQAIDRRFVVANASLRKGGLDPVIYYNGLIMFQEDTNEVYVCIDQSNASSDASWKKIFPASGSGEPTGSNTEIQFNDNGNFGASSRLTFGKTDGLLRISGSFEITGSDVSDSFLIKSGSSFNAFKINDKGVSVLGNFQYTPTVEEGGIMYSSSNLYVGS